MNAQRSPIKPLAAGYTLIEVMIAVFVLSIGLVALGFLQVVSVQASYNAHNRALASIAAQDMAERIRANVAGYTNGQHENITTASGAANACDGNVNCTTQQLTDADFARWQQQLAAVLPAGQGILCMDGSDGNINDGVPGAALCSGAGKNVIKIFWRESLSQSDANAPAGQAQDNVWRAFGLAVYP